MIAFGLSIQFTKDLFCVTLCLLCFIYSWYVGLLLISLRLSCVALCQVCFVYG
jgi:hypothetical protein